MMFEDLWNHRLQTQKARGQSIGTEIAKIDGQIEQLLNRVVEADSSAVIRAYESRINDLEADKIELKEKLASCGKPVRGFEETFITAMEFSQSRFNSTLVFRTVLKLTFTDRLAYVRTVKAALPFKLLADFSGYENIKARPDGLEPPTPRFEARSERTLPL